VLPIILQADASACCYNCRDKIDREEEAGDKNIIVVTIGITVRVAVKARSGIFLLLKFPNRKLVHILSV
jgi:hypothetical protein